MTAPAATLQTRKLGSFERAEALTSERFAFNIVVVLELVGTIGDDDLRQALDRIQARHPMLRARIVGSGGDRRFEVGGAGPIPIRRVGREGPSSWQRVVEDELNHRIDLDSAPLLRCVRVEGEGGQASELILTLHHVIADGVSALRLVDELVRMGAGDPSEPAPELALPAAADELFPAPWRAPRRWPASVAFLARQAADELAYRARTLGQPVQRPAGPYRCRVLSKVLNEVDTTSLVRATRRHRVGLSSALSAAMLLAVVAKRHDNRAGPYRYFTFPLLRSYLEPPVDPDVVAGYLTTLRMTAEVKPEAGLWSVASDIHRQVDQAAKRGERYLASVWSEASMRLLLAQRRRMAASALNYSGAVGLEAGPGASFAIRGLHAFVTDFMPGPEFTGQARIYDRRLWLDLVYLDVDMSAEEAGAIADRMLELLAHAVESEESR